MKAGEMRKTTASSAARARKLLMLRHAPLALILLAAIIGAFTLQDHLSLETLRKHREALLVLREMHFAAMISGFVAVYITIVALALPGAAVASITGGFLFGLWWGTALNVIAASSGAIVFFHAANLGLGQTLAARLDASDGRLKRIKHQLNKNEISVLLLLRLIPAVPFCIANLLPALVGVRRRNFILTTVLGIIPGALVFASIGVGLGEVFDAGGTADLSLFRTPQLIFPLIGLSLLAALPLLLKLWRGKEGI